MSERDTSLKIRGKLVDTPKLINTAANKLFCEFTVVYQPNKKYDAVFLDFIAMKPDLSEYLAATFKKGDDIRVLSATPASRKSSTGARRVKWVVWDIAMKDEANESFNREDGPEDDVPY